MLSLRSDALELRIDPAHGGEVLDLVDRSDDCQLLGRPPFLPAAPRAGELDEATWTASYRGGWQLATPNAGAACDVAGVAHGFHGRASNDPWAVVAHSAAAVGLSWAGHGLTIERTISVHGRTVTAQTTWTAGAARVPFLVAEHLALGPALLDPGIRIELAGGRSWLTDEAGGPPRGADDQPWPRYEGGRADTWSLAETGAQFLMVADLPAGQARAVNVATGRSVLMQWDLALMPHLWLWREARGSAGIWGAAGEILGLEPASVSHGLGLAEAITHGQAHWLEPGEARIARTVVTVPAVP